MNAPCVMLVAIEPSGDGLGGALAAVLRERLGPGLRLVGVGGPSMAAQGLASPFDPSSLAVVGVFNAAAAYPEVLRRADEVAAIAKTERPDAAILIDAWGFNLRVAHRLRRLDPALPLIKYVAPQVWASRPGRARTLARAVDHLLTIHGFDAPWFEAEGLPTTFVGNPALNRDFSAADPAAFRASIGAGPADPILLLLPGSRAAEIDRLMPVFEAAVRRLTAERPDLRVAMGVAEAVADRVRGRLASWLSRPFLVEGEVVRLSAMRAATVALACSGTVTTELALAGCPMVVAYKLGPLTHQVAKILIRTRYITLFNVAAQAFVAPERVQGACRADILAVDLARLLDDPAARKAQITDQTAALEIMRGGIADPIAAAADAVVAVLSRGSR